MKIWMYLLHEMKIFMVFTEKEYFYFIVYTPMCVSDVITDVTKQNMNVKASTLST